jgi:predicted transcriptional regulator of viral defense system
MKYMVEFLGHFSGVPAFTAGDARLFLSGLGASDGYASLLLTNLVRKGELRRIKRGVYTFGQDPMLAGFAFSPSYHGLQDALSLLELWDQETNAVIVTPLRVRTGMKEMLGGKVMIRRIDRRLFFGFDSLRYFDYWLQVSDVEKTLIDFVYFREPLQDAVLAGMREKIDKKKLDAYLKRCPGWVRRRVRSVLAVHGKRL